ncbi:hypothetical protein PIB30_026019 [Stylosanthes scabra]|uniref:Uncharacterized protein n=1 Tax=Stylosanthes scabra TaxID=79078 RepID=A0ABU6W8Q9_9FABA|nr:hypothetical protein [Stylosanthes scabra]
MEENGHCDSNAGPRTEKNRQNSRRFCSAMGITEPTEDAAGDEGLSVDDCKKEDDADLEGDDDDWMLASLRAARVQKEGASAPLFCSGSRLRIRWWLEGVVVETMEER